MSSIAERRRDRLAWQADADWWQRRCLAYGWTIRLGQDRVAIPELVRIIRRDRSISFVFRPLPTQPPDAWPKLAQTLEQETCAVTHTLRVHGRGVIVVTCYTRLHEGPPSIDRARTQRVVPIGVNPTTGMPVAWNVDESPHGLLVGPTGSGKSSALRRILLGLTMDWLVDVLDAKSMELGVLEQGGRVRSVAAGPAACQARMSLLVAEMHQRNADLAAAKVHHWRDAPNLGLRPVLVVVDEAMVPTIPMTPSREDAQKAKQWLADLLVLLSLARACGMHVLVSLQRPDTDFLGGPARDQLSMRLALGGMSLQGAMMVFGREDTLNVATHPQPRGRGWIAGTCGADQGARLVAIPHVPTLRPVRRHLGCT